MGKSLPRNLIDCPNMFWKILISSMFALASVARADVVVRDLDVSVLPELSQSGWAWEQISEQSYFVFEGLNVPLINIKGTKKSWYLEDGRLEEWTSPFPRATLMIETVKLPDGSVIGGPTGNHLRFVKPQGESAFRQIPEAAELYWTDHVEGSGAVLAKRSKDGPLLVLQGDSFVPSPIPEKGQTQQGEFLPWYSVALGGYFTAWAADIWFYRAGDPDWRRVEENENRSWSPAWGLFERGSNESLSPDATLLKVISDNRILLTQYRLQDGYPVEKLHGFAGQWHQIGDSSEIVGWHGRWHRNILDEEDRRKVDALTPKFVRFSPNSDLPETIPDLFPLILSHGEKSIIYQYHFATMPETDRLYFLHSGGFAYYSDGVVTRLPAEWLDTVGKFPKFLTTEQALYIAAQNGLYLLRPDNKLTEVIASPDEAGFATHSKLFDLVCAGQSIGFFGWKTGIYSLKPTGEVDLILQSEAPIRAYGTTPDGMSVLFSEKDGRLNLLTAEC